MPAEALTPQQIAFFDTFGYLVLPGLFSEEIAGLTEAFESVFADHDVQRFDVDVPLHRNDPRTIIPRFIDQHPALTALRDDPRILAIADSLLGEHEYAESDGNLAWCDSKWHADTYGAPLTVRHLKISFYLDELRADSGAIRVIPGTNDWDGEFARQLRRSLNDNDAIEVYGIEGSAVPSVTLDSSPGDILVWDYRTVHASFNGKDRRRFFSVNFKELSSDRSDADLVGQNA